MEYPKPIMRKSELIALGFDKEWLNYIFRMRPDLEIAWKGEHKNSPVYYDTKQLEKYRRLACHN